MLNLRLGLTLGIIMLVILMLFSPLFYYTSKSVGKKITTLRANYRLQLNTWLIGNAELTVYGAISRYRRQLDDTEQHWQLNQRLQNHLTAGAQGLLLLVTGLSLTLIVYFVVDNINDNSIPGTFIALFVFATLAIFEMFKVIAESFQYLGQVIASAVHLNELLNQNPTVIFPLTSHAPVINITICVYKIKFYYKQQIEPAINALSLTVASGEHVAILGHTGSGKSTLLQLLTRSFDPQVGVIMFNDIPLPQWNESAIRAMTSVVPQKIHLFSATLRDNLRLAAPNANDLQLSEALKQVGLENLLLNEGLDAWLGDGGRQLSSGEQRRIGIARALLHDAPLWLLDEPLEGIDSITEQQILLLFDTIGKGRTLIIVTHRLLGLDRLDRIYIMDHGSIIEQGTHHNLMAQQGRYYHYNNALIT